MKNRIDFRCLHCNQRLSAKKKKETAERQTTCPNCYGTVEVPDSMPFQTTDRETPPHKTLTAVDTETGASTSELSNIRLQIKRGVVSPWTVESEDVYNDQFIGAAILWGLLVGGFCFAFPGPLCVIIAVAVFGVSIWKTYFWNLREVSDQRMSDATAIADSARRHAESHFAALRSVPSLVDATNQHLKEANQRYQENAFGPFWDSIQEAVRALDAFRQTSDEARLEYDGYRLKLSGHSHTFPVLPNYGDRLPDPLPALQRLEQIVRLGQTNFQFATIWEQRRTREAIMVGFDTWADAVSQIASRVLASFRDNSR